MRDHRQLSSTAARYALRAAILLSAGMLAGCPPVQNHPTTLPARPVVENVPAFGPEPVAGGIFVSLGSYTPLSGAALTRALTGRAAIQAAVAADVVPTTAPASQPSPASTQPAEAPPLAVKYYLQGREKFLDGANTEAMEFLEKALQLDPHAFTVLRLMGRVCFASSQLARGSLYLQRAQQGHPTDVEVNYLLGRYWLERKDTNRAIYYLMQADESPERSAASAQTPMVSFYLARSLQAAGYHKAAASQYGAFLELAALPVPGYRYERELNYLIDEPWATHLSIAENDVLVGDFAAAFPEYRKAEREDADVFTASRLVNAAVHLGKANEARQAALDVVSSTKGADGALQLLAWVYRAQHREGQLAVDLRARLGAKDSDDAATLTLAATLDYMGRKNAAFDTLADYLSRHPNNLVVLDRLLKRIDSPAAFSRALHASAAAIAADPASHDDVMKLFLPATQLPNIGQYAASFKNSTAHSAPYMDYLGAITEQSQHADPTAISAAFAESLRLNPDFLPAREAYVTWLLSQEKFAQASTLIQQAVDNQQSGPKTWRLFVESEAAQQRLSHALQLSRQAVAKFPNDPDIHLQLASLYTLRGQNTEADAELNHTIEQFPKWEPAYKALIDGLVSRAREEGNLNTAISTIVGVLGKMNRELPNSKFAQITSATIYARAGRLEESEAMLRRLLAETPDDPEILIPLAQVRQLLGHPEDGETLLSDALKNHPQPRIAEALISLYREQGKTDAATALADRLVKENPDNETFALLPASILTLDKRPADALAPMSAAAARFPHSREVFLSLARLEEAANQPLEAIKTWQNFIRLNGETPDRLYELSHFYSAAEDDDAAVAALQRVLALMPDHTGANNDLGFFWADKGVHLDEAERMIRKAVDNEPNNAAFLDSLGWLLYKRGKFADAIPPLEQAVAQPDGMVADVIQHLGDALYRAGRRPEAFERWTQALALVGDDAQAGVPMSKSRLKLKTYLDHLKAAMRTGEAPAVTPAATDPKPQSAGPAPAPSTLPSY